MLSFVESYRNLTKIKTPEFTKFNISDLYSNITTLLNDELNTNHINLISEVEPKNLQINADEKPITQVLMNLMKNAIESLLNKKNGQIKLEASFGAESSLLLKVIDNGTGFNQDIIDQIFIPFFSTKKEGSGIGLSLSRQIINLHQGRIFVHSIPDKETTFTLIFI